MNNESLLFVFPRFPVHRDPVFSRRTGSASESALREAGKRHVQILRIVNEREEREAFCTKFR